MVLLMLKKKDTGKTWACVTEAEKKAKETKKYEFLFQLKEILYIMSSVVTDIQFGL